MISEIPIEYAHEDTLLEGILAIDEVQPSRLPGVLIAHAWSGRSSFEVSKARALAARGYAAFAIDVYGKGVHGADAAENQRLMAPWLADRKRLQARLKTALATFTRHPRVDARRIVVMGYCFGGLCALDMARSGAAIRGAVSFHGLLEPPTTEPATPVAAKILVLHGYDDPFCPPSALTKFAAEMTARGADWQVHAYGHTQHSFTNPEAARPDLGTAYHEAADARAWCSLLNFLEEVLGVP